MRLFRKTYRPTRFSRRLLGYERRVAEIEKHLGAPIAIPRTIERVIVSQKMKILASRVQKNANSSLVSILYRIETGLSATPVQAREKMTHLDSWPIRRMQEIATWRRIVIVRNPYSRVLSAFLDKFSVPKIRKIYGEFDLDPVGFGSFLKFLEEEGGLAFNGHWDLQTKQLMFPIINYTDVIRFENFSAELPRILCEQGAAEHLFHENGLLSSGQRHKTAASEKLVAFYNEERVKSVARIFRTDFGNLGFDPERSPLGKGWIAGA